MASTSNSAAARVNIVQSGLSSSIRALERELGAELFNRTQHPLADRAGVRLADLAGERFLDFYAGWGVRALVDRAAAAAGVERRIVCEANDVGLVLDMVVRGLGVALLPEQAIGRRRTIRSDPAG